MNNFCKVLLSPTNFFRSIKPLFGAFNPVRSKTLTLENPEISSTVTNHLASSLRSFGTFKSLSPVMQVTPSCCQTASLQKLGSPVRTTEGGRGPMGLTSLLYQQTRGLKIMGKVRRRCKRCYIIFINGNKWNLCDIHPRHKQIQKPPYFANQRILTHVQVTPKRPY